MTLKTRPVRLSLLSLLSAPLVGAKINAQLSLSTLGGVVLPAYEIDGTDVVMLVVPLTEDPAKPGDYVGPLWPNTRGLKGTRWLINVAAGELLMKSLNLTVIDGSSAVEVPLKVMVDAPPYAQVFPSSQVVSVAQGYADAAGLFASLAAASAAAANALGLDLEDIAEAAGNAASAEAANIAAQAALAAAAGHAASAGTANLAAQAARDLADLYAQAAASGAGIEDSVSIGRGLSAATTGPTSFFQVKKGGLGPDDLTPIARQTMYQRTGAGTQTALYAILPAAEFDAVSANIPTIFESLDPALAQANLVLDPVRRILAQFPDPAIAQLSAAALTNSVYETLDAGDDEVWIKDPNGRILVKLAKADLVKSLAASVGTLNTTGLTSGVFETLDTAYAVLYLDPARRILGGIPASAADGTALTALQSEVAAARGTRTTLATRLAQGLTPYGDPISPHANKWVIRETRMRFRKRALAEAIQWIGAFIGDSYTQNPSRYMQPLAKQLQDLYGFAGIGYISFGWFGTAAGTWTAGAGQPVGLDGTARSDLVVPQIIGTWTCSYNVAANNTPSLSKITSSTAGDYVAFAVPAGHSACTLFYAGDGTGVIAVSWDGGATYGADVALATVGAANVALAGTPAGAVTCRIKVISGNVALAGVDLQSTAPGVRIHKLGGSGSSAAQWASVTGPTWAAQMLALGSHFHNVMHGTNDQSSGPAPATFATNIGTIFANLNTVLPYSDRKISMPAENQRTTNAVGMPAYAQAAREYALANDCAFIDGQYYFGSPANFAFAYSYANTTRQWYAADLIHPDPNTGGRVIVDAEFRLLTSQ